MSLQGWQELLTGTNLMYLLKGLRLTVEISLISIAISLVVGVGLALWHTVPPRRWGWPVSVYVTVFRGIPLLVLVFFLAFGLPSAGVRLSPYVAAVVGFTLYNSAMVSEALRGSLKSISSAQLDAGLAHGFSRWQSFRLILLPQAMIRAIPVIVGQAIVVVQGTSLVSAIGVRELTMASTTISSRIGNPIETIVLIGAMYYVLDAILARGRDRLEGAIERKLAM